MYLVSPAIDAQYYMVKKIYPSQVGLLQGAGLNVTQLAPPAWTEPGTVIVGFKTAADWTRAQGLTRLAFAHAVPVANKYIWIINSDFPKLAAAGIPLRLNLKGRVFSRVFFPEWELYDQRLKALTTYIDKVIDPNTVVDPALALSREAAAPAAPDASILPVTSAIQPLAPASTIPTEYAASDVPQLAPPTPATPAPAAPGTTSPAVIVGVGALAWLLMGKK